MKTQKSLLKLVPVVSLLLIGLLPFQSLKAQEIKFFPQENSSYPFSKAVQAGDIIFLSGILGTDKNGHLDPDFRVQSKQVMENIKARLEEMGLGMKDIVKCTVMIKDMSKWADFNEIYRSYFEPDRYPARSAFGVTALALGAEMEVEVIACSDKIKK
ncbi:MAG: RidA family protein [Bacteroidales bacterium]|jgi:reactive intermediate/imine deaminase